MTAATGGRKLPVWGVAFDRSGGSDSPKCAVVAEAKRRKLMSNQHFTVDGTLLEAWASLKSFRPKDDDQGPGSAGGGGRNPDVDYRGQKRSNATHASTTDPEARLARKGNAQEAKLYYGGPCAHGEPQRPGRRGHAHPGDGVCGTAGRASAFDDYRAVVRAAEQRVKRLEAALHQAAAESRHTQLISALQGLRGMRPGSRTGLDQGCAPHGHRARDEGPRRAGGSSTGAARRENRRQVAVRRARARCTKASATRRAR
jgi:hypothetical protein